MSAPTQPVTFDVPTTALPTGAPGTDNTPDTDAPCPYCPTGTTTYRYDMGLGSRWFRCDTCGIEMPEARLDPDLHQI